MNELNYNTFFVIKKLWGYLTKKRKIQILALIMLTLLTSFAEVLSLGTLIPLLGLFTNPDILDQNIFIKKSLSLINIKNNNEALIIILIIFSLSAIFAGFMRLFQTWANIHISFLIGSEVSIDVYKKTLYQPYSVHISRNSSEIINAVSVKVATVISGGVLPIVVILTSFILLLSLTTTLILINYQVAFIAFFIIGFLYSIIFFLSNTKLKKNSLLIARHSNKVIKSLQEGLGAIRDVIINNLQKIYLYNYEKAIIPLYKARGMNQFIAQSPRLGIEALGMVLIAILIYFLSQKQEGLNHTIPIIGTFIFGAQRMLPVIQQIYISWTSIQGSFASLLDVLIILGQVDSEVNSQEIKNLNFKKEIKLENISFRYDKKDKKNVLNNINLIIPIGKKVGFVGKTGSGKSTLLDIIMGLLTPTKGNIKIDGEIVTSNNLKSWQKNISHVPQTIFLADSSIEENIAFGIPYDKIDKRKVKLAASKAQIHKTIKNLPNKYQTLVGERGIRLSGGQRQRIGIARAIYKGTKILILDEATSALDNLTEKSIINSINAISQKLTVLAIAHRVSSLEGCDFIVEIDNGSIKKIIDYSTLNKG